MKSKNYKNFLRQKKINNFLVLFTQITLLVLFFFIWQFLADKNLIDTFL